MSELISKIVTAVHWKYEGQRDKPDVTDVYFNDGSKLALDGHWMLEVGKTYIIAYNEGNPVDVESMRILL